METKSLAITYILWLFLGWLGAHQFYLRRDRHAFFTWATLGGVCGIGWLRDLFYIPTYVTDVNEPPEYMERLQETMRKNKHPKQEWWMLFASAVLAYILALFVYMLTWDKHLNTVKENILIAVGAHTLAAVGVYFINNEGRKSVEFQWCIAGAYAAIPLTLAKGPASLWCTAILSALVAGDKMEWKRQPTFIYDVRSRAKGLSLLALIYVGLLWLSVYRNIKSIRYFEEKPVDEPFQWTEFLKSTRFYHYFDTYAWSKNIKGDYKADYTAEEIYAYQVLNVTPGASEKDIKSSYRRLVRTYHPDKQSNIRKKKSAYIFMEIRKAYELLSKKSKYSR